MYIIFIPTTHDATFLNSKTALNVQKQARESLRRLYKNIFMRTIK